MEKQFSGNRRYSQISKYSIFADTIYCILSHHSRSQLRQSQASQKRDKDYKIIKPKENPPRFPKLRNRPKKTCFFIIVHYNGQNL